MSMNNLFAVLYLQKPWPLATEARENKQSKEARWSTAFLYLLNPSLNCLKNTSCFFMKIIFTNFIIILYVIKKIILHIMIMYVIVIEYETTL